MNNINLDDTIAAVSTPIGEAGIGIVRLSGKDALKIADKIFKSADKNKPSRFKTYTTHYGWVIKNSKPKAQNSKNKESLEIIDEVILTVMRAPKSYTKEDVVEINCHSGIVPLKRILDLTIKNGARLAEPGEFTRRALLNGRIDLVQAEAVLDIIKARTDKSLAVGLNQLKGRLSQEIDAIRNLLLDIYAEVEALINFPEDEISIGANRKILERIRQSELKLKKLLDKSDQGRILREGIKVVICGKPNVGKSSLLNLILKEPRAIVTDIPGTTRDTIEEVANIRGIPVNIIDTAGIIEPKDLVEKEAIKRSRQSISSADLVILVFDASRKISSQDSALIKNLIGKKVICAINKCDLKLKISLKDIKKLLTGAKIVNISCLKNKGIAELEEAIAQHIWQGKVFAAEEVMVSNLRQIEGLRQAFSAIERAGVSFKKRQAIELSAEELKSSLKSLDEVLGKNVSLDLLDTVFAKFCIGK